MKAEKVSITVINECTTNIYVFKREKNSTDYNEYLIWCLSRKVKHASKESFYKLIY